ncbi:MAG: hypothetical protein COU11_01130 [Candidatus Harrisonbacteria bacterium CG10_big_fil_rev_8_21_14_0_10_49_15]|uniref:YoaR-like putative peptidoglycan binding domain-containing protein n=1 Tax=Candidatus Harrisonbacteria bacterium CG10_big_fil_rev_8_21_14_0_10_49_15 TaxID=1974587 RepID=A0A2H0ULP5_9BACT|nr:MAG: hypothetical protein COU11_01130 [Candidatus Harrisonbacteria bacterium CG10_big_fil_rev_8_21_14_0_10_49_15]
MRKFSKTKIGAFAGGLILFLVLVGAGVAVFEYQYVGRFYPGVQLAGENISGKTYSEVADKVRQVVERLEKDGIVLVVETAGSSHVVSVPQTSVGLTSDTVVDYYSVGDWEATLAKAYQRGRSGSLLEHVRQQAWLIIRGQSFEFPFIIRQGALSSLIERELDRVLSKPQPAHFVVRDGTVEVAREQLGERVSVSEVIGLIDSLLRSLTKNTIPLVTEQVPVGATSDELRPLTGFVADAILPLVVRFNYNGYWAAAYGGTLASWLTVSDTPEKTLEFRKESVELFLHNRFGVYIENPMSSSRFAFVGGKLEEIVAGQAGEAIAVDKVIAELNDVLRSRLADHEAPLIGADLSDTVRITVGTTRQEPVVTKDTVDRYDIRELVATARTSFGGSTADRKHNIALAAAKLNGVLIAPGEEFSTVNGIGYITEDQGYKKEYVIKGNESVKELGGGLCQLATTLFRTALNAGVQITERQNHSYVVGYYGPGLDATIYGPHPDLRFMNDTGHYLLLQGRVEGDELVFELYGQKDGRVASISEPKIFNRIPPPPPKYIPSTELALGEEKCTEQARYGMEAEATYTVKYQDGSTREQIFKSKYRPWQKVCLVGVGQAGY